jgi:betaine reductase
VTPGGTRLPSGAWPVVRAYSAVLAHAPDLVCYGSKPRRDLKQDAGLAGQIRSALRPFAPAAAYPPHQVFIGTREPESLAALPKPWWQHEADASATEGPHGLIWSEEAFYGLAKMVDPCGVLRLEATFTEKVRAALAGNPHVTSDDLKQLGDGVPRGELEAALAKGEGIPLGIGDEIVGVALRAHEEDEALGAQVLLENLACKATGVLALRHLLARRDPGSTGPVEYVIGCGEEAVGDRYQRGGGNMGKAIAEAAGLREATGADVKSFCASPLHALLNAAALVQAGIFQRVAVVAGGSLAKLGMKSRGHLAKAMPILEDVLAGIAILVEADDGASPIIRTDAVGRHRAGTSSAAQAVTEALVVEPLSQLGLSIAGVEKFATELHNPEITLPAGSGDVPLTNYRMIGAMAALRGEIPRDAVASFVERHGMPGFSPTQGHIASAVCYLGHALDRLRAGRHQRTLLMAKGSLFLGRMTNLADGISLLLERNPRL